MKGVINLVHMIGVTSLLYYIAEGKVPRKFVNGLIAALFLYHFYLFLKKNDYISN